MPPSKNGKFYAVAVGKKIGIYKSWSECQAQTRGFPKAKFKKFSTQKEAQDFINGGPTTSTSTTPAPTGTTASNNNSRQPQRNVDTNSRAGVAIAPWTTTTTTTTNSTTTALHNPYNSSIPLEHSRKHTLGVAVLTDESATHINLLQEPPTSKRQRREATAGTTTTNTNARRRLAIHIMFDGGARGNPGVGGSGASITVRDTTENLHVSASSSANESLRRTIHVRYYVGANVTNNQAEYQGLLYGLAAAKREVQRESGRLTTETAMTTDLLVQGDSNLIIEQLKGSYRVNSKKLIPLYRKAKELLESISNLGPHNLSLEHVYRDHNKVADGLANQAMDSRRSWFTVSDDDHTEQHDISGLGMKSVNS